MSTYYWKKGSKWRSGILEKTAEQTNSSISLQRLTSIGSSSTFVFHGKLRRERKGVIRQQEFNVICPHTHDEKQHHDSACWVITSPMHIGIYIVNAHSFPKSSMEHCICYSSSPSECTWPGKGERYVMFPHPTEETMEKPMPGRMRDPPEEQVG